MKNYGLTPRLNSWKISLANFLSSARKHLTIDFIQVIEEEQQFYLGNGKDVPSGLLPFQTAVKKHRPEAVNVTATLTDAQLKAGVVTSTSAAAVTMTTRTAAQIAASLGAKRGTWFDFAIDNSTGENTVTLAGGTNVSAATAVITGGATLTVASGAVGLFRIYFTSETTAKLYRLG